MNRKDTTKFLGKLLIEKLNVRGKYYASEVSIDYGTSNVKRIDFLQFEPKGVIYQSDIEKGMFTCYEVKSCKEDVYSGNGLNFLGEKNYIVMTMECYKEIQSDMRSGKLDNHIKECNPESSIHYGIMVPIPVFSEPIDEYENPTSIDTDTSWKLHTIYPCHQGSRRRSTTELLFCMLRSGKD